ncbi:cell division protein DamX [Pseudescherichia vulneris]|mgnify:CR=1 FL=1|uniref:cell division protein DamX n=1 Tax=Pseudescherichia vulneris TaxID=566 RepID=UPI0012AB57AC|nr:cell division protein DamX [Pseudescherichia vulneris]MDU5452260.1 cell division protein DamX [Pseudescherichia vulneris]
MDEFKPEDELKTDPSDRRPGRTRQSSDRDSDPQINFDDVDLDADDRRPSRTRKAREEVDESYEEEELEESAVDEERVEHRPRKRKKAPAAKPASRQYLMMGLGILVLLLLIVGIGSALKSPADKSDSEQASSEKSVNLSDNAADQANGTQPAPGTTSAEQTAGNPQDVSLPPIASTPTQGQTPAAPEGQQRVEVQGDLNNALAQPQNQNQVDSVAVNSTLPTEPATVAPVHNAKAAETRQTAASERQASATEHRTAPRTERQQTVIEPKPAQSAPKAAVQPKRTETAATTAPATSTAQPKATASAAPAAKPSAAVTATAPTQSAKPATTPAPAAAAPAAAAPAATANASTGNVGSLKSAPGSHYTLQLSSSSNYNNLNAWAKKENLKNFVVYQTSRNGQPWYVLVSGVYASKDDAKRAVSTLPADVQAKNPWAKPLHQVQADLK